MARRIFLHLYLMRVPILMLLVLGWLFPSALQTPMLHGLADLEFNQVAFVTFAAFLLLCCAVSCCFLVLLYGSERADGLRQPPPEIALAAEMPLRLPLSSWMVAVLYLGGGLLFFRFLLRVQQTMTAAHLHPEGMALRFWIQAGLGTLLGTLFIVAIFVLDLLVSDPRSSPQIEVFALPIAYLFRKAGWLARNLKSLSDARPLRALHLERTLSSSNSLNLLLVRILGPGYGRFDERGNPVEIYPGHRFAGFLAALCFGIYLLAGRGVYHRLASDAAYSALRPYDAVLLQVILLLLLACWTLSAICFYFDRFRIPVLIPIALILLLTSRLGPSDHAFHTVARPAQATLLTPADLLAAKQDRVIVVAAAGGGIQSAAWTSEVLCGLRHDLGPSFDDSVLAISGVSGGSVGTMFYLRCVESSPGDMQGALAARNSSLEAVAWGLAHPDLRRAVLPIDALLWPGADRGWALERALRKNAQFSPADRPLAAAELQKRWPVILLNATEVRTGDPIVFTNSDFPVPLPAIDPNHALHGFHEVYSGRDVNLESAVRMSAAFPYVSPAARPDWPGNAEHLVDGGYFDNSGLFTLTKWLKAAIPDLPPAGTVPRPLPNKKILILSIDAFPDGQWTGPADAPHAWLYQLIAPAYAILHVRSEGQQVRDLSDSSNLLQILQLRGYEAATLTARYVPSKQATASKAGVDCPQDPPLTWHLTEVEKACIDQEWNELKPELISQINAFFAPRPTPPSGAPAQVATTQLKKGLYVQKIMR
ncbi:MAG TPA: patatin-like phospholipase family protein [Candidatus Limnocylindrales bacterium]|nr:patatin-like phospholipase family protein [Candidatus Limnocylindrales bacterium]